MTAADSIAGADASRFALTASRQFTAWLAEQRVSLAFTTYQSGKLFFLGLDPATGRLSVFERTFNRCMGLWASPESLYVSSLFQLWRFENAVAPGQAHGGYDRLYVPQLGYTTGDLDVHDIAVDGGGRVVFVNTLFSCLATVSDTHSFTPLWRPGFVSRLAAEDRCHLNGLAMDGGRPRFVTAVGRCDVADSWRDRRRDGGCVVDVASGEIAVAGLSMPHSPRFHGDKLWLLDSGSGFLGVVDAAAGRFEPLTFCPGYARGLAFVGGFAVVGLSRPRENATFAGLALDDNLAARDAEARCGLLVVDLASGDIAHWVRITGVVEELYDVAVLEGVTRPMALGFQSDEICRMLMVGDPGDL